ncbi:MAG: family 16 glycoside hydrolase [Chloroflexota bacterium]
MTQTLEAEPTITTPPETAQPPTPRRRSLYMWLLLILVALIVLLGVANLGIGAIKALGKPVSGSPGNLLYATTFDQNFGDEWTVFDGQMASRVVDGSLRLANESVSDGPFSVLKYEFADFDVRVNATRLVTADSYDEIGLLFRHHDPSNFYMFNIRGDGAYRVIQRKNGQIEVKSEWHVSPAVLQGLNVVNQLRVVAHGDHFQFFINGQNLLLCPNGPGKEQSTWNGDKCLSNNGQTSTVLQDSTFQTGNIGVGIRVAGLQVAFDNIVIYAP